MILKLLYKTGL